MIQSTLPARTPSNLTLSDSVVEARSLRSAGGAAVFGDLSTFNLNSAMYRVIIPRRGSLIVESMCPKAEWLEKTLEGCERVLGLKSNWDTYGSREIEPQNVVFGLQLLADILEKEGIAPAVVPTSSGSIQFEWHRHGTDFEICILSPGYFSFSFSDGKSETSSDFSSNVDLLREPAKGMK